jgi:hypothetical protein
LTKNLSLNESSSQPQILSLYDPFYFPSKPSVFQVVFSLTFFRKNVYFLISSLLAACPIIILSLFDNPISFMIVSFEACRSVIFSFLLSLRPSELLNILLGSRTQKPSMYVLPLGRQTKFWSHTKPLTEVTVRKHPSRLSLLCSVLHERLMTLELIEDMLITAIVKAA